MTTWTVPAISALGALLGAWGGQWLASKRDDLRWQREMRREDLRWERERKKEEDQRKYELEQFWRDQRIEAYTQFFVAIENWSLITVNMRNARMESGVIGAGLKGEAERARTHCHDILIKIELMGSQDLQELSHSSYCYMSYWWVAVTNEEGLMNPDECQQRYVESLGELIRGMQAEAGLDAINSSPTTLSSSARKSSKV